MSVAIFARIQSCPEVSHLNDMKTIFKHIKGIIGFRLWYPKNISLDILGYSDADFAGC